MIGKILLINFLCLGGGLFALPFYVSGQNMPDGSTREKSETVKSESKIEAEKKPAKTAENEIQLTYGFDRLSNGYGNWRTVSLDFSRKYQSRRTFYGSLTATERFGRRDRQATLGIYQPLNRKWALLLEGNYSPTHRSLAKWSAFGGIEHNFGKGWNGQIGYRRTRYSAAKVNVASVTAEKYFGNYRAAYTLSVINLEKVGTSAAHRFQFAKYYGEQVSSVGLTVGYGRELESLGNQGVLQTDVKSIGISGHHWINKHWGINYDASITRQGKFYTKQGASIGVRYRF